MHIPSVLHLEDGIDSRSLDGMRILAPINCQDAPYTGSMNTSDLQQAAMRRSKARREARKHVSSRVGGTDGRGGRARAARRDRSRTADGRDNHTRSSAGSATGSRRRLEALTSHGVGRSLEFQFQVGIFARCPRVSAAPKTEPFPTTPIVGSVAIYFRWTESTSECDCNKVGVRSLLYM